jgi:hypothetical protein
MPSILEEAHQIIYGDREQTYGKPSKNLDCIAQMWDAYLTNRKNSDERLGAVDVAAMMTLLKIARLANSPDHLDSLVDAVGYLALIERCQDDAEKRDPKIPTSV